MIRAVALLAVLATIAACSSTPQSRSNPPPKPDWQTDASRCNWNWREGGGIGLWTETCRFNGNVWQVVFDRDRAAFVTRRDNEIMSIAVQRFVLPKGAGLAALGQTLIETGQLLADAACDWQNIALRPAPRTTAFHMLAPTDPAALRPTALGEVPEPVCGPYGASTHGVRYFITDLRWPDVAIFVEEGQERPMFDPSSITDLTQ